MDSKTIFEKIQKRNKFVITCANARNNSYSQYLKAASLYDNLKKGFYIALQLSKTDGNVAEERKEDFIKIIKIKIINAL